MGLVNPQGGTLPPHMTMCQDGIPPQRMAYLHSIHTPETEKGLFTTTLILPYPAPGGPL